MYQDFKTRINRLLFCGSALFVLYAVNLVWLCDWDAKSILYMVFAISANFGICYKVSTLKEKRFDYLTNLLTYIAYSYTFIFSFLALYAAGFPGGSFPLLCILFLAGLEITFYNKISIMLLQYFTAVGMFLYSLSFSIYLEKFTVYVYIAFVLLIVWKFLNHISYIIFKVRRTEQLQINMYKTTIETLKHELNNAMTLILGSAQLIADDHEKKKFHVQKLKKGVGRISDLLIRMDNLENIDFIRYESDKKILKL